MFLSWSKPSYRIILRIFSRLPQYKCMLSLYSMVKTGCGVGEVLSLDNYLYCVYKL